MKAKKAKLFFGGVHPHDMKALAKAQPIEDMPLPTKVLVSLNQSLGKKSVCTVNVGQSVKEGELIAKADGNISSNVFAPLCGTVTEIKNIKGAFGDEEYIVITSGEKSDKVTLPPLEDPTPEEIKARVFDAGIVGLGGAGFPAAVKLSPDVPIDTLIVNGAECEPYITCDYRLMLEKSDEIAEGARLIAKALGATRIIIGIEKNKMDCVELFEKYDDIQPIILKRQYPMGGEKQLIYVTTGKKVAGGKLPSSVGVVVQNTATCYAVYEAVKLGVPLYKRVLTVSGKAIKQPKNLLVRVGTPIEEIVTYCGGESVTPKKVILGGPMMGTALSGYGEFTHKVTSAVLLLDESEAAAEEPTPCLNCGKCADVCPMRIMPMDAAFYSAAGDFESAAKYGGTAYCIECGACEYVCPAKRPLIAAIRKTKAAIRNKEKEQKNG